MQTFIVLTRLMQEEVPPSFSLKQKERRVVEAVKTYTPNVIWLSNYALAGAWDYLDIFQAADLSEAMKVSALIRYCGGAHTELWPVMEWSSFEEKIKELEEAMKNDGQKNRSVQKEKAGA